MNNHDLSIDWIDSVEGFCGKRLQWHDLISKCGAQATVFHSPEWIEACWSYPENDLLAAIVRKNKEPLAGFVFNAERDYGSAVLWPIRLLGLTPHLSNAFPSGLIYLADPNCSEMIPIADVLAEAFSKLRCNVGFFSGLNHVDPSFKEALSLISVLPGWRTRKGESSTDAWLKIDAGREAYLAERSGKFRQKQRRARRDLSAQGQVAFLDAAGEGWEWNSMCSALVDAFERSWQVDSEESPLFHTRREATLEACQHLHASGAGFHLFFYQLNQVNIAFEFGLSDSKTYYPLVRGHDKTYARQSPGNLLVEESIAFLHERGVERIFLGAIHLSETTKYKTHWMNEEVANENILLMRKPSLYERIDRWVEHPGLFQKLWWRLDVGARLRAYYSKDRSGLRR